MSNNWLRRTAEKTEEWKKKGCVEVRTWGIFHLQKSEIQAQPRTSNCILYIVLLPLSVVWICFPRCVHTQRMHAKMQQRSVAVMSYWNLKNVSWFTIAISPKTNLWHHGDMTNRMKYSVSWPSGHLCPWLTWSPNTTTQPSPERSCLAFYWSNQTWLKYAFNRSTLLPPFSFERLLKEKQ